MARENEQGRAGAQAGQSGEPAGGAKPERQPVVKIHKFLIPLSLGLLIVALAGYLIVGALESCSSTQPASAGIMPEVALTAVDVQA